MHNTLSKLMHMKMDQIEANRIAQCAIDHYINGIPSNGGKPQSSEWTVYAAIVACRTSSTTNEEILWVVSCGTGSKCTSLCSAVPSLPTTKSTNSSGHQGDTSRINGGGDNDESICKCYNGLVIKDSHAETLARRGLMACLWDEVEHSLLQLQQKATPSDHDEKEQSSRHLLELCREVNGSITFHLKEGITLHMYVSDSPCGDAAIYEIKSGDEETELNFTGAKIILPENHDLPHTSINGSISSILTCVGQPTKDDEKTNQSTTITLGREHVQQLGALRLKSSRSNIPPEQRSTSMSCSDKIVRWLLFGIQGSLLSAFIPEPIVLSSICVSKDPRSVGGGQLAALQRAIPKRIKSALTAMVHQTNDMRLNVHVVDTIFESSKSASENRYFEAQHHNERKRSINHSTYSVSKQKISSMGRQDSSQNSTQHISYTSKHIAKKASACGMSINWYQSCISHGTETKKDDKKSTEITIGATGLKRGKKPKKILDVLSRLSSRLCRYNLVQRCIQCNNMKESVVRQPSEKTSVAIKDLSYVQYKQKFGKHTAGSQDFEEGPLAGYIRSGKDGDFIISKIK